MSAALGDRHQLLAMTELITEQTTNQVCATSAQADKDAAMAAVAMIDVGAKISTFRVLSLKFRVLGSEFRDRSSICRVQRLEDKVSRAIPTENYANDGVLGTIGSFTELRSAN